MGLYHGPGWERDLETRGLLQQRLDLLLPCLEIQSPTVVVPSTYPALQLLTPSRQLLVALHSLLVGHDLVLVPMHYEDRAPNGWQLAQRVEGLRQHRKLLRLTLKDHRRQHAHRWYLLDRH